jgi:hypothetical protein
MFYQSGFARPVFTNNRHGLAASEAERNITEHIPAFDAAGKVFDDKNGFLGPGAHSDHPFGIVRHEVQIPKNVGCLGRLSVKAYGTLVDDDAAIGLREKRLGAVLDENQIFPVPLDLSQQVTHDSGALVI